MEATERVKFNRDAAAGKRLRLPKYASAAALCLLLTHFGAVTLFALDPQKSLSQYSYDVWQTKHGLPQNSVRSIAQTSDGYLWLGTAAGLVRFDGVRFTVFNEADTELVGGDSVRRILAARDGSLWIGAHRGRVLRLKEGKLTAHVVADQSSDEQAQPLYEDRAGHLWIGTPRGAVRMKDGEVKTFTTGEGLVNDFVTTVCEDREGGIWVGTWAGVTRIKDGKSTSYAAKDGLTQPRVSAVYQDRAGHIWIGTRGGGLYRFEGGKIVGVRGPDGAAFVQAIYEDRDGNLWIGTQGAGLCRVKDGQFSFTPKHKLLPDTTVQAIHEDREGNLWVGTRRGGLVKIRNTKFTTYSTTEQLPDDHVYAIYEEPDGSLWTGTRGGLTFLKDGKSKTFTKREGLSHNTVRALYKDHEGNLWVGTYGAGINCLKDGKLTTHGRDAGVEDVVSIYGDASGNLWVASTLGGLGRFKDGKFDAWLTEDERAPSEIRVIYVDRAGQVWIGTKLGLYAFRDGRFRVYTERDGLSGDNIRSLYEDAQGNLWVGTNDAGLNRFRDGVFTAYTSRDGLFDNAAYQILEDSQGNLWVGSGKGIYRIGKKQFDDFDRRRINSLTSVAYGVADGMKSEECTLNGRVIKAPRGSESLIFPTIMGVVRVDPDDIKINDAPPAVHIEQIKVDQRPVGPGAEIAAAPPGRGDVEIHYTGLSFAAPERIQFKYKLEGFDREWVEAGARRMANYANLPPGDYRFRVIAANHDGVWNEAGASFALKLQPHFYQTYAFFAGCVVAAAFAVWWVHLLRVRRMRTQFAAVLAERTRIARELHDTLLQGFAGIAYSLKAVVHIIPAAPQAARQHLERTLTQVNDCLADARRSVWELRSDQKTDSNFASALVDSAKRLTADRPVATEIQIDSKSFRLPHSVEENLLRIGQEAITNAVKHARAANIRIELSFDDRCVTLSVRDDGSGFDEQTIARRENHFGLLGMRERAKQIGGQLTLHSNANGTEVLVIVPVR